MVDLHHDIKSEDEDEILNSSETVATRLSKKYSLKEVSVNKDKKTIEKSKIDQQRKELTISFYIPFTGNVELLKRHPSSYTSGSVYGKIKGDKIVVDIENAYSDPKPFQREFDSWYDNMKRWLDGANGDARSFNDLLPQRIKSRIDERAQAIRSSDDIISALR